MNHFITNQENYSRLHVKITKYNKKVQCYLSQNRGRLAKKHYKVKIVQNLICVLLYTKTTFVKITFYLDLNWHNKLDKSRAQYILGIF